MVSTPSNALNINTAGIPVFNGTSSFAATTTTQYNVLTGSTSNAINNVAPSATSGVPVISQGASAQPVFGTAAIAGGGTNATSFATTDGTVYFDGTRLVTTVTGTSGQVLTSNGAGVAPTYQAVAATSFTTINIQVFTSTGTYTPTANMKYCLAEVWAGGGGGGGCVTGGAAIAGVGAGGGAGGYARSVFTAAAIGASQAVTVGAGGLAGTNAGGTGGTGGTSSVGALISATGGVGGEGAAAAGGFITHNGGAGGAGTGTVSYTGAYGGPAWGQSIAGVDFMLVTGAGGNSYMGYGGQSIATTSGAAANGVNGSQGGGGSGAYSNGNSGAKTGGVGGTGYVVITEFI